MSETILVFLIGTILKNWKTNIAQALEEKMKELWKISKNCRSTFEHNL